MYYVICDQEDESEYCNRSGETGNKIYDAPFQDRIYNDNAFKVLQILQFWTSNCTAQTYMDQSNDFQDARHISLTAYEGYEAINVNI
jgi:hypothetical protein